jgi:hypothetical protein
MMAAFVRNKTRLIIIFDNLGVKMRPPRGDLFHPKTPENGFFGPPKSGNPERAQKSGEFLGPKLSTPTILPIRAKTGFWGGFFGPLFWLFLEFYLLLGLR